MKTLAKLSFVLAILAFAVTASTWPVESSYASRAHLMLRMQKSAGDDLFGDSGTPIGSPQQMIVDDSKAILSERGEKGVVLLDENYLNSNKIHPLQLQTVRYVAGLARVGAGAAGLLLLIVGALLRRRTQASRVPAQPDLSQV